MNLNDEVRRLRDQIADINRRLMAVRRAVGTHNLLSSVHPDTTPASAVRGDLITGQAVAPLWKRLALGTSGKYLRSDGTDVVWSALQSADFIHASEHEVGGGDLVDHDNLTNFLANEHIDWTNATANFKTTVASGYAGIFMGGNVGIGTTAPYNKLHIRESEVTGSDSHVDDIFVLEKNGNTNFNFIAQDGYISTFLFSDSVRGVATIGYNHTNGEIEFAINNITTVSPNDRVVLLRKTEGEQIVIKPPSGATGTNGVTFQHDGVDTAYIRSDGTDRVITIGANTGNHLAIKQDTGNVGIGTISPATSAKLEISSTTGALLLSRMTTAQRDALTAVNGMLIYNTTTTRLEAYENGAWVDI